ncbi:PIR protein [Plasmodium ovale]|uniref:PIR Superfamily Protein n=2 Tax=Plasmodium ovale TaxID=36330 RepID=A0A1A8XDL5_PLAOA|nr:PIR Superfamily Protein [Plasmodium ovale curtisi]SBT83293.1 PIR protein [Plasmodium ovale]
MENILKELPAYEYYKDFNNDVSDDSKEDYEKHCSGVKISNDGNEWVYNFCLKFVRNLKEINKMKGKTAEYRCLHLIYWAYDEIKKKINNKTDEIHNIPVFYKLYEIGDRINKESKDNYYCSCYFHGSLHEWTKEKNLHDYFKNYKIIKDKISSYNDKCRGYSDYISYINEIYLEEEFDCCINSYLDCHKYFDCDIRYRPSTLSNNFKCYYKGRVGNTQSAVEDASREEDSDSFRLDRSMIIKFARCIDTKGTDDQPLGYKCEVPKYNAFAEKASFDATSGENVRVQKDIAVLDMLSHEEVSKVVVEPKKKGEPEMTEDSDSDYDSDNTVTLFPKVTKEARKSYTDPENPNPWFDLAQPDMSTLGTPSREEHEEEEYKTEMEEAPRRRSEDELRITPVENDDHSGVFQYETNILDDNYIRVVIVAALALGTLLVFFIFYKFTPLGSWLHKSSLKKNRIKDNLHKDMQDLYEYDFEYEHTNPRNNRINVAYHST